MDFIEYIKLKSLSLNSIIKSDNIRVANTCDEFNEVMIAADFYNGNKSIFVILPNLYNAQKYYDSLISFCDEDDVLFFPADELISAQIISSTGDFLYERIQTIYTLLNDKKKIVVMNMHAAIKYELPKDIWVSSVFKLKKNDTIDINDLIDKLIQIGYQPTFQTTKTADFSKRGSIVDIFPLGYERPIRLDFFGDDIETIKFFNTDTQRSAEEIDEIDIIPVTEFLYYDNEYENAKKKIELFMQNYELSQIEADGLKKDLYDLSVHKNLDSLSRYLEFFNNDLKTILDYSSNKKIYLIDPAKAKSNYDQMTLDLNDYCQRIGGYSMANMKLFYNFDLIRPNVLVEALRSIGDIDINVFAKEITPYKANQKNIVDDLRKLENKKLVIVSISNEDRLKKFKELLLDNEIDFKTIDDLKDVTIGRINIIRDLYPAFELTLDGIIYLNESSIFDVNYAPKRVKYKSIYKNAIKISKYDELVVGDYVVHYDYGIGKYLGIKTIKTNDIERDFIHVMYGNNSALYIPLEQISSIMKYASFDTEGVKLNTIGSTEWARTKAKVRKKVHDISDKLIALYSARSQAQGYKYPPDSIEQAQFENDFQYELTLDQAKAIRAIKSDMESSRPMDRLVCGDVGYGKTEVALRAAFKAVYAGKQVCMLAPTTLLARQHYLTFKNRMEDYGIRVELLSRFVSPKKQKEVIEGLAKGGVDVVIGTHKVLSPDIKYHDLGLLIVDEEQRFGVSHKERIKELKVNIDCITLSATPIPRTLQMSVMGIKDLSMIETPPKNRYPIQTYVLERNDRIIASAIEREIARGGQVFYLYNYTQSILEEANHIQKLVPEAKIAIGHGKLSKDELEDVISKFIDKEYNVLLCTTIIETGIDMPDTNTLIIHDADRLGLAQMYQIRGRVGRSSKIAYAYLMYEPRKVLTPEAEKRLETIKEFNELGSGYKIAMRDLSIRGSGDILGSEQSGFVETVGMDVYLKILDEELNKKEPVKEETKDVSLITPMASRTIRTNYIDNDDARISIHKKIDGLKTLSDMSLLIEELKDRFGDVSDEMLIYMYEKIMKSYCELLDIYKIDKSNRRYLNFVFTKQKSDNIDGAMLFSKMSPYKNITLTYTSYEIHILLEIQGRNKIDYFKEICHYLDSIYLAQKQKNVI